MPTQVVWTTPPGSLGTIPQGVFYQVDPPLLATSSDSSQVHYEFIAGDLPSGMVCLDNGIVQGVPTNIVTTNQQIESELVPADVISKFAIRAYTTNTVMGKTIVTGFADQTFTMTVVSQNRPKWITLPGSLGEFYNGLVLVPGIQLQYTNDNTTGFPPAITLVSGSLPPGLIISSTGLIHGTIELESNNTNVYFIYTFTLKLTDGVISVFQTFSMSAINTDIFSAPTTVLTADTTVWSASNSDLIRPIIINAQGSIGTIPSNSYFAYQFTGYSDSIYTINYLGHNLPPGLSLDSVTGFLYGTVPLLGLTEITYSFTIQAYDAAYPQLISQPFHYALTVSGLLSNSVTWLTPSYLGTIANGGTSMFYVSAINSSGLALTYQLLSGSNSSLPQGLTLNPSGNIVGRVSFNTFALDKGTTYFDNDTTSFDLTYTFTVNAVSANGYVNINKEFSIRVLKIYATPYNNIYVLCMPPENNRQQINNLLENRSIFNPSLLYRPDDANFGLSTNVTYHHAYGLYSTSVDNYLASLRLNHYWKNLVLGGIETAQALDPVTGEVIYEVVYSTIVDDLVNNQNVSVGKDVVLAYPVEPPNVPEEVLVVYPNSLDNMRNQVIDTIGQESNMLPLWMLSKQTNGNVLGFTPAWVIAYTVPGASGKIAYEIQNTIGDSLNLVDFEVDRYELDDSLSVNWNLDTQEWVPTPGTSTTFDVLWNYDISIQSGGYGYGIGSQLAISGTEMLGINPDNWAIITVADVDSNGAITQIIYYGTAAFAANGLTFSNLDSATFVGYGLGATFNVTVVPGRQTVFDGNSLQFNIPTDLNTNTDAYDKYLIFPRRNILSVPETNIALWLNNQSRAIVWLNNSNIGIPWTSN